MKSSVKFAYNTSVNFLINMYENVNFRPVLKYVCMYVCTVTINFVRLLGKALCRLDKNESVSSLSVQHVRQSFDKIFNLYQISPIIGPI